MYHSWADQEDQDDQEESFFEPQGHSPRGILSVFDAALDYYYVLARVKPSTASISDGDDYGQVDFHARETTDFFRSESILAARVKSIAKLKAARIRLEAISPGKFIAKKASKLRLKLKWTPKHVLLRDKLTFTAGVVFTMLSMYWLGYSPETFYQLYTVLAVALLPLRFFLYKREKMHYYLLDFCYYANLLLVLQAWALPEWCLLEKALFSFATGPLAWSIILFRNSMIFHSLDKMTSLFVHAFPPIVVWTQRWYHGDPKHWKSIAKKSCDESEATMFELVFIPWIPYVLWAVVYYMKIFVISSARIQDRGYHTLFKYVVRKPASALGRLNAALPRWAAPIVYMLWHVGFCAVTFVLAYVCWRNYWIHSIFLITMLTTSAWNGGNFYFDVFAHRYLNDTGIPSKGVSRHTSPDYPSTHEASEMYAEVSSFDEEVDKSEQGDTLRRSYSDYAEQEAGMMVGGVASLHASAPSSPFAIDQLRDKTHILLSELQKDSEASPCSSFRSFAPEQEPTEHQKDV